MAGIVIDNEDYDEFKEDKLIVLPLYEYWTMLDDIQSMKNELKILQDITKNVFPQLLGVEEE